jgi:2-C-methyl-D-erythritol 4-phosphate cytidylyltransferase/2-C-methyl-D-erythritol 2,4-cyclodiphosphate synthase
LIDISLIILAAGSSTRFGTRSKKQWFRCGDQPLWNHVTEALSRTYAFKDVIVAGAADELAYMYRFTDAKVVKGGATREASLANALQYVTTEYVLVSDAARPNIPRSLVEMLLAETSSADCVVPYLTVADTVVYDDEAIDRAKVRLIQTPQLSRTQALLDAISRGGNHTDESGAIRANGGSVRYIPGDARADKLTSAFAGAGVLSLLPPPSSATFGGIGYDVHAFEEGKPLVLCGVQVDEKLGLKAHSDGDVAIHALIDALLGAAGAGDIGEWFPDTDPRYKNADSVKLLDEVVAWLARVGYEIVHCDITIIAQKPKISPFKQAMSKRLSQLLGIAPHHINIKATTTEGLGFTGRGEGIAVQAAASLKYYDWRADENLDR